MKRFAASLLFIASIALGTPLPNAVNNVPASKVFGSVSTKTGNYTAVENDSGQTIVLNGTSITLTLPAAPPNTNWSISVVNINSTSATVSRNGLTINGAASDLTLAQNASTKITTDGSNYFSAGGGGGGGTPGGTNTQLQYNNSGAFGGISTAIFDGVNVTITDVILKQVSNSSAKSVWFGQRFTDTTPAGHLQLETMADGTTALWDVGIDGTLNTGIIPSPRVTFTDVTTGNASTTAHGFQAKGDNNTAHFYRSDNTQTAVTDANLSLTDITTNNASTTAHGFQAKGDNNTAHFYRSDNTQTTVSDANLSVTDVTTNNVSTSAHGFAPKAPNDATQFLNGTGAYSTPAGAVAGAALFTSTADASNVHLTADTSVIGTGSGSKTTAANYFKVGTTMIFIGEGYLSTAASAATLDMKLKAGSTVLADTGAISPSSSQTNQVWRFIAAVTCRTTGASGTFQVNTIFDSTATSITTSQVAPMVNTTTVTLDTTATQAWDLTAAWGATTTGDTITGTNFIMFTPGSAVATDVQILSPAASPAPSPTPCTSNGCTQSYTWTKPASGNSTWVYLVGAGGGGGGGDFNTGTSTAHCGGGGGGAGAFSKNVFPTALLGSTETVTVGIGGAGGAAKTTNANGGAGINGGATSFGAWLTAGQGGGGNGGTSGATCTGTAGAVGSGEIAGGIGGAASTSGAVGNTPAATNTFGAAGGASGGGITTGNAGAAGNVGAASANNIKATPLAGGTAGSGPSTAGGAGTSAGAGEPQGGAGGGSGGCAATPAGGSDGGAGGLYGGGGGGGGAGEATTSGAGGHGGYGVAVIITTN